MLPSLQMHHMVQPSLHLDSPSPIQLDRRQGRLSFPQYGGIAARASGSSLAFGFAPAHRAFPIRSSQPPAPSLPTHPRSNAFMIPSHLAEHDEHQLRRKTPNGTIDAGYDGNPAQLASGPPPLKHMILPASSNFIPTAVYSQQDGHAIKHQAKLSADNWSFQSANFNVPDHSNLLGPDSNSLASGGGWHHGFGNDSHNFVALDCTPGGLSTAYYPYNNGVKIPTALQPIYQHSPGPAIFDNGGLLPPSAWPDANMPTYHPTAHPGALSHHNISHQSMSHIHSANVLMPSRTPYNTLLPRYDEPSIGLQAPAHGLESLTLESTPFHRPRPELNEPTTPGMFREKALANAHRSYIELLAYLHHNRKSHGRSTQEVKTSKMVIFPKLPRPQSHPSSATSSRRPQHAFGDLGGSNGHIMGSRADPSPESFGPRVMKQQPRSGGTSHSAFYHLFNSENSGYPIADSERVTTSSTPLSGAKTAVVMLTHLCEQSGWKWVDGMLLGGCLHYGLEHYEQSLEWFQRIVSLDETHVEAISNVAAALYCLNRHDEAERHWLRAVRLRPSYLEAVEHLVGLLCSNHRSKEAVDIIDSVQQSIRLHNVRLSYDVGVDASNGISEPIYGAPESHAPIPPGSTNNGGDLQESRLPGFSSSGYRVAGSENGRVIALIHAKGNMLYALKDIDRASEAFEEAVLISTGRKLRCIHSLIRKIQSVLSPPDAFGYTRRSNIHAPSSGPLLLPPERARHTAQLVFATHGELPGLRFMPEGTPKRSAISTTSNSLLSLAKIFQDAMSNGGTFPRLLRQPSGIGDILALYYLSLSLSESPSTANNVGILLASVQHTSSTQQSHMFESPNIPQIPGIAPGSGLALALAYYNYGLSLDSKHVHLHTNLGSLLKDIGQLDLAIQMYEQAVACDGNFDIALTNLANAVKDRGRISDAIIYYRRAVNANPDFAEAVCGLSTALNSVCDWNGRGGVLLHGGTYDRWHVDEKGMLRDVRNEGAGSGLMKRVVDIVSKQLADSYHWGAGALRNGALELLSPQLSLSTIETQQLNIENELRKWAGRPWEGSRILRLVERSMKTTMRRWYLDVHVHGRPSQSGYPRLRLPPSLAVPSAPTVLPFHTFTCPLTAKDIRMISQRNAARISCSTLKSAWLPNSVYMPPPPPRPHLNVGYVSSDFNNHPLAHLMQSVFGFHDPSRAKAFCYATTASDKSVHRLQIEREAPVFRDVSNWPSEKLVEQIVRDEIHILVNLNGYTRGARNEIFAARPAPIQMSFMGFAGTLGAEWCDYILADETAIPPSTLRPMRSNISLEDVFRDDEFSDTNGWMYSENIVFCRDTFFCCDHAQSCDTDERKITWADEQRRRWKMRKEMFPNLPDDTIILGNFNQLYKIEPSTFRTWLRILSNVPKAILWLLRFPELGENNLKKTARAWAGEDVASRIIFTDVAPKQQHISRARICDLFLDTPECNAHTTAADVLWSSTPLLTLPRYPYKMCSRMAASILKGALPKTAQGDEIARELIASNDADYESLATRLAGSLTYQYTNGQYCEGYGRLAEIRRVLFDAKWTCALFDTHRWVTDLERAYQEAWRRWVAGEGGDIYL
ncbi:glycosyltransferase family 41 protein [Hypoxylon trugodes]|uniref:glycosyltransferase family 41 protein n=1 Tax=Hypoxylon trugodes TaxID=326681 RepID=UPI0021A23210|nr:glycosyltransferase family 41 protein [Hypoxylon trugodes]KAI1391282.1 glycosyltransferase family 41 protein [Hypoxylon trugodes]